MDYIYLVIKQTHDMKKVFLVALLATVSIGAFAQSKGLSNNLKNNKPYSFSFGLFARQFGDLYGDMRTPKWGGIGMEAYSREGSVYGKDYSSTMSVNTAVVTFKDSRRGTTYNGWSGIGFYYITPSVKGFDLSIGGGSGSRIVYEQFFDNSYILSPSGNYHVSTGSQRFGYTILGVNKSIPISQMFEVELKVMRKIASDESMTTFGAGFRMNL